MANAIRLGLALCFVSFGSCALTRVHALADTAAHTPGVLMIGSNEAKQLAEMEAEELAADVAEGQQR